MFHWFHNTIFELIYSYLLSNQISIVFSCFPPAFLLKEVILFLTSLSSLTIRHKARWGCSPRRLIFLSCQIAYSTTWKQYLIRKVWTLPCNPFSTTRSTFGHWYDLLLPSRSLVNPSRTSFEYEHSKNRWSLVSVTDDYSQQVTMAWGFHLEILSPVANLLRIANQAIKENFGVASVNQTICACVLIEMLGTYTYIESKDRDTHFQILCLDYSLFWEFFWG